MALSAVNICNLSLLSIGAREQISSFTEGSTQADACAQFYPFVFNALGRAANWNCLRNQDNLTLIAAAQGTPENQSGTSLPLPPQPWLYAYQLPPNCWRVRYLMPQFLPTNGSDSAPVFPTGNMAPTWFAFANRGQIPFAVAYGTDSAGNPLQQILTNITQAQAVYTVNQSNPAGWDSQFTQGMVAALAAYLVPALALNMPLMQGQIKMADNVIAQARVSDGDEGFTTQNRDASWIVARGGSSDSLDGAGNNGGWYSLGDAMAWPG